MNKIKVSTLFVFLVFSTYLSFSQVENKKSNNVKLFISKEYKTQNKAYEIEKQSFFKNKRNPSKKELEDFLAEMKKKYPAYFRTKKIENR